MVLTARRSMARNVCKSLRGRRANEEIGGESNEAAGERGGKDARVDGRREHRLSLEELGAPVNSCRHGRVKRSLLTMPVHLVVGKFPLILVAVVFVGAHAVPDLLHWDRLLRGGGTLLGGIQRLLLVLPICERGSR
jgi:hypothetical protein